MYETIYDAMQDHMVAEIRYQRQIIETQRGIIKQLVDGPGEFIYIHPFDLMEIFEKSHGWEIITRGKVSEKTEQTFTQFGEFSLKYIQTPYIPAKSKRFK